VPKSSSARLHADALQCLEHGVSAGIVVQKHAFGDFQLKPGRIDPGYGSSALETTVGKSGLENCSGETLTAQLNLLGPGGQDQRRPSATPTGQADRSGLHPRRSE
jgi:hypothetical protein